MHRPTLNELPPPPPARTGWPWTEESSQLPDTMSDGSPWPRVSIVTPSYNQGQFIEETFRSVLLQDYPNLEYIVTDGGSTDGSVEVIRDYERWLAYWVSEKDQGQSHAINKGFTRATGDFWAWLNSDDIYLPNTVSTAMYHLQEHPEWAIVYGSCEIIDSDGIIVGQFTGREFDLHRMLRTWSPPIPQPGSFFRRVALQDVGLLDETLHCQLDYDFFLRLSYRYPSRYVPLCIGAFRRYPEQKTHRMKELCHSEHIRVRERFLSQARIPTWQYRLHSFCYRGLGLWNTQGAKGVAQSLWRHVKGLWHDKPHL